MSSTWLDIPEPALDSRLRYDRFTRPDPAAGSPLIVPLDSAFDWYLIAAAFQIVTDANVAARLAAIDLTDTEGTIWHRTGFGNQQAASLTNAYFVSTSRTNAQNIATTPGTQFAGWPRVWYPGGMQLRINVVSIQAGDQISGARFFFAKLMSGPRQ